MLTWREIFYILLWDKTVQKKVLKRESQELPHKQKSVSQIFYNQWLIDSYSFLE